MNLRKGNGEEKLRRYIHEVAEEQGIDIERVEVHSAGFGQTTLMVQKRIGPETDDLIQSATTITDEFAEQNLQDSDYDPVAHELEDSVRRLKEELTERFNYQGHDFFFYPYDDGEVHCPRCDEKLEMPIGIRHFDSAWVGEFDTVDYKYQEPSFVEPRSWTTPEQQRLMKKYIHGWAVKHPCDEIIDYKRRSTYHDP